MSKFTFICEDEPDLFGESIHTKRTVEFNAVRLDGIIGEFETFLRGCGFNIDGYLEVTPYPTTEGCTSEQDDLDNIDSIFSGKKSLIRSDEC